MTDSAGPSPPGRTAAAGRPHIEQSTTTGVPSRRRAGRAAPVPSLISRPGTSAPFTRNDAARSSPGTDCEQVQLADVAHAGLLLTV